MSSVDDLITTVDLDTGSATIYEKLDENRMVLVKEFPSREEADAYIQHQVDMDAACAQIHENFQAMAAQDKLYCVPSASGDGTAYQVQVSGETMLCS